MPIDDWLRVANLRGAADREPIDRRLRGTSSDGRFYIGRVFGLAPGVRVDAPVAVKTNPCQLMNPPSPGVALDLRPDPDHEEEVVVVSGKVGNGDTLLAVRVDGSWVARRRASASDDPCPDQHATLCVYTFNWKGWCDWWRAGSDPGSPPHYDLGGVAIQVDRAPATPPFTVPRTWTPYATGVTASDGRYCVTVLPDIDNPGPGDAPTVDPLGGGDDGGPLAPGEYRIAYSWFNAFGQTPSSPPSAPFQVGVPDPQASPTLGGMSVNPIGGGVGGGNLDPGRYVVGYCLTDADGSTKVSGPSPAFTVAAGNVPRVLFPAFTTRPNALALDVYLAPVDGGGLPTGPYALYEADLALPIAAYDFAAVFPAGAPAPPTVNGTARTVPEVTFPAFPAGVTGARIWNVTAGYTYLDEATDNPHVLGAAPRTGSVGPPTLNTTAWGFYRIKATIADCPPLYAGALLSGGCRTTELHLGFCCWKDCIDSVTDADGGDLDGVVFFRYPHPAADPDVVPTPVDCYNAPAAATAATPTAAPGCSPVVDSCMQGLAAPPPSPDSMPMPIEYQQLCPWDHTYRLQKDGYWPACIKVPGFCDVPAKRNSGTATMYSKEKYLAYYCCGNCDYRTVGRPPYLLRKLLMCSITAHDSFIGALAGVPIPLVWDPTSGGMEDGPPIVCNDGTIDPHCDIVWDSGCLPSPGYGACYKQGTCAFGDCSQLIPLQTPLSYYVSKKAFGSFRVRLTASYRPNPVSGRPCKNVRLDIANYWDGGCAGGGPPICFPGVPPFGRDIFAAAYYACTFLCPCRGTDPPDATFISQLIPFAWTANAWDNPAPLTVLGSICGPTNLVFMGNLPNACTYPYNALPITAVITEPA